jgi:hypothetical protein
VIEAATLFAQHVGVGHPDVLEVQLRGVLGVQPHLRELAASGEAGHVALDDQQREALVAGLGIGAGDHNAQIAVDA